MNLERLKDQLSSHEGYRQFPYKDTEGILTIGIGRNLKTRGITKDEALYLLENDIRAAEQDLRWNVHGFEKLDEVRQAVLIDMVVNMGIGRLMGFTRMLAALAAGNYAGAASEMLESKWAGQVKGRAVSLAEMMRTGEWPVS